MDPRSAAAAGVRAGAPAGARAAAPGERRAEPRPAARPRPRSGVREPSGRAHPVRGRSDGTPERILGAYASGARARLVRPSDGPVAVPGCRPVVRPRPAVADTRCVPPRRPRPSRLSRYERAGGARRLAGETRAGVLDRVLAVVAVALASATVVVVLGLLADVVAR
ncbi:hypothetical protein ACL02T_19310 [Pseudonocardia sp. RS010]|uniref:hypothetical protein n=1 Tax=Pseudonocardia sp. RS010 TaxID=3385979 RepID=UPI0039A0B369